MVEMVKGNGATAETAARAGVKFYVGCLITPSGEIMEYLSWHLPEVGGNFVQAESGLAGVNIVIGAAAPEVRILIASSGPGISLEQESVPTLSGEGLSTVAITQIKYGSELGTLPSTQCDYNRRTGGDSHGDYRYLVFVPTSVQEFVDLTRPAYELTEKHRVVSAMMGEATLGQMMEPVTLPDFVGAERTPWVLNGHYTYKRIDIFERGSMKEATELVDKYSAIRESEQRWEDERLEDTDYAFMLYGVPDRSTLGAVRELRVQGEKVGIIRPITVWPSPEKTFYKINSNVKGIITMEANATGQLVDGVTPYTKKVLKERNVPAYALTYVFGTSTIRNIEKNCFEIKSGSKKEVYWNVSFQ